MKKAIVLCSFFILTSIHAKLEKELKVNFKLKQYELSFSDEKIRVKDRLLDLSVVKKKCNENIFNELYFLLLQNFKGLKFSTNESKENSNFEKMIISQQGSRALLSTTESRYLFYSTLVDEIRDFKVKESMFCY